MKSIAAKRALARSSLDSHLANVDRCHPCSTLEDGRRQMTLATTKIEHCLAFDVWSDDSGKCPVASRLLGDAPWIRLRIDPVEVRSRPHSALRIVITMSTMSSSSRWMRTFRRYCVSLMPKPPTITTSGGPSSAAAVCDPRRHRFSDRALARSYSGEILAYGSVTAYWMPRLKRGMTDRKAWVHILAAGIAPELSLGITLKSGGRRESRVLAAPAASRAEKRNTSVVATGSPKRSGLHCAIDYGL